MFYKIPTHVVLLCVDSTTVYHGVLVGVIQSSRDCFPVGSLATHSRPHWVLFLRVVEH